MTPDAWTLIAGCGASLGAFGFGLRLRRDALAQARAVATEAMLHAEHADQAKRRAEAALVPLEDRLRQTDAALSVRVVECERLQAHVARLVSDCGLWERCYTTLNEDWAEVTRTLATTHVRIGSRYHRYRADGVYPALAAGPEAIPAADMPLEPAQKAQEGNGPVFSGTDTSKPRQTSVAASETRARGQGAEDADHGRYAGLDRGESTQQGVA